MKVVAFVLLCIALCSTCRADQVDYTFSVVNAPGGIGDFSWEIATTGFIEPPPVPAYVDGTCTNCDANYFDSFLALSAPSNGDGCGITKLFLAPGYALTTFFAPLCDGLYDSFTGGGLPDPGVLGTWNWQGTNPDGTENFETLTITDPPGPVATPEPSALSLACFGLIGLAIRKARQ